MTRKDFELIATILKSYRGEIPTKKLDDLVDTFATHLALKNERFNKEVFINATKNN